MIFPFLYIGPGMGVGTIVIVLAVLALIIFSFAYLLWVPIKRFFRKFSSSRDQAERTE
ncbi:MAG: hypothetical protein WA952_13580 [Lewinella sp.]